MPSRFGVQRISDGRADFGRFIDEITHFGGGMAEMWQKSERVFGYRLPAYSLILYE